jgi:hypothetical protein
LNGSEDTAMGKEIGRRKLDKIIPADHADYRRKIPIINP